MRGSRSCRPPRSSTNSGWVVVADEGSTAAEADLIAWVKQSKGSVLAPKSVDFVDEIPLTAVGKHDKPALRATYWHGQVRAVH